jgi:hypothetical protein
MSSTLSIALPIALMLAAASPALAASDPAQPGEASFSATLSGASEVDAKGVANHGDPDGKGSFSGRLASGRLCYSLSWSAIDTPTMAHIHSGAAGINGPVLVPLDPKPGEHCVAVDAEKAAALLAEPAAYYVNVHNATFPGGAARGQLATK